MEYPLLLLISCEWLSLCFCIAFIVLFDYCCSAHQGARHWLTLHTSLFPQSHFAFMSMCCCSILKCVIYFTWRFKLPSKGKMKETMERCSFNILTRVGCKIHYSFHLCVSSINKGLYSQRVLKGLCENSVLCDISLCSWTLAAVAVC